MGHLCSSSSVERLWPRVLVTIYGLFQRELHARSGWEAPAQGVVVPALAGGLYRGMVLAEGSWRWWMDFRLPPAMMAEKQGPTCLIKTEASLARPLDVVCVNAP